VALRRDDIDLATGRLHVRRAKAGDASVHPIPARESRALRQLLREAPTSPYVSSRNVAHLFPQPDISAWWPGRAKLANDGHNTRAIQAYLAHRSIMSTVRYTALTPNRFKNFWKD